MQLSKIKISDLKSNSGQVEGLPKNPRLIKSDKYDKLKKSLQDNPEMLELREVIAYDNGGELVVICGNMRLKALKELGYKETFVKVLPQDTATEKLIAYTIKDNISYGEMDWDIIANEFNSDLLIDWGLDLPIFETEEKIAEEDNFEVPEGGIETDIVLGDLFEIGSHKLICGDSTKPETWQRLFGDKKADLVVTDPPYNVNYGDKAKMLEKYDKGHRNTSKILNDNMNDAQFLQFLTDALTRMCDYSKKGAAIYVFHADTEGYNFRTAFKLAGYQLKQCLIWVKNSMVMGRQDYQWKHEPCLYGWKEGAAHYFIDDRTNTTVIESKIDYKKLKKEELLKLVEEIMSDKTPSTVIHCDKPTRNDLHPTMKPILLLAPLIRNSSKPGQIVADGFLGSGSTMVTSHQLKRRCFGQELDPKYCEVILQRMKKLDPEIVIKKNGILWQGQKQ